MNLWIKRDDIGAEPYAGNKVRKLAFLLGDARKRGCRAVVTFGGYGSNHALATAIYARMLGMKATLMLLPEPNTEHVRHNLLASVSFGAKLKITSTAIIDRLVQQSRVDPVLPDGTYVIAPGGTSVLGNIGYVDAGFELSEQVRAGRMPEPDIVAVAAGTMGTASGLLVGLRAAGIQSRVVAVRTSSLRYVSERTWARQVQETVAAIRVAAPGFPKVEVDGASELVHRHVGRGYAWPTVAGQRAMELMTRCEGLSLDAMYTGKAFGWVMEGGKGKSVLFWNTYDARALDVRGLGARDVPAEFRGYFRRTREDQSQAK